MTEIAIVHRVPALDIAADVTNVSIPAGLTPVQERLVFHEERLLHAPHLGPRAEQLYRDAYIEEGLPPEVAKLSNEQAYLALYLLETACLAVGMTALRDCHTNWEACQ